MKIVPFENSLTDDWDNFCYYSNNATFLHTRKYLNYHKDRFQDRSLLLTNHEDEIIGLFPAAESITDPRLIISHPGISYGGLISAEKLYGEYVIQALEQIIKYFHAHNYDKIQYKAIPHIYHKHPSQDDLYAMFRLKAERYRSDLSSVINLSKTRMTSTRRTRCLKKAQKQNLCIISGPACLNAFWAILEDNLSSKHDSRPTHNLDEIKSLMETFPQEIELMVVKDKTSENIIAGIVLYHTESVTHSQYIASNEVGKRFCALDLLFNNAIEQAREHNKLYFSFGISNESDGIVLNQSLYQFKHEFGAGGICHDFFRIQL